MGDLTERQFTVGGMAMAHPQPSTKSAGLTGRGNLPPKPGCSLESIGWLLALHAIAVSPAAQHRPPMRRAKPNEPNEVKTIGINMIARKRRKQTQACYPPSYQWLTRIFPPILRKFVWICTRPIADSGRAYREAAGRSQTDTISSIDFRGQWNRPHALAYASYLASPLSPPAGR